MLIAVGIVLGVIVSPPNRKFVLPEMRHEVNEDVLLSERYNVTELQVEILNEVVSETVLHYMADSYTFMKEERIDHGRVIEHMMKKACIDRDNVMGAMLVHMFLGMAVNDAVRLIDSNNLQAHLIRSAMSHSDTTDEMKQRVYNYITHTGDLDVDYVMETLGISADDFWGGGDEDDDDDDDEDDNVPGEGGPVSPAGAQEVEVESMADILHNVGKNATERERALN